MALQGTIAGGTETRPLTDGFNFMLPPLLLFAFLKEAIVPMTQCWQMVLFCAIYADARQQNLQLLPKETPFSIVTL